MIFKYGSQKYTPPLKVKVNWLARITKNRLHYIDRLLESESVAVFGSARDRHVGTCNNSPQPVAGPLHTRR